MSTLTKWISRGALDPSRWILRLVLVLCIVSILGAILSPMISDWDLHVAWEAAAMFNTVILFVFVWVDILYSRTQVHKVMRVPTALLIFLLMFFLTMLLLLALSLAASPWGGPFSDLWDWMEERLDHWVLPVHAFLLVVAATVAALIDLAMAKSKPRPSIEDGTEQESLRALEVEQKLAARALRFIDIPAIVAFMAVFFTILLWCKVSHSCGVHHSNPGDGELKMFLGGSVALALVMSNIAYFAMRAREPARP